MQSRDFCYWLQGFFELTPGRTELTAEQVDMIRNHLNMVFAHEIDPSMGNKAHQDKLNDIHAAPYKPNVNRNINDMRIAC